jgi:ABC-2 type transport system ATP-binding protein
MHAIETSKLSKFYGRDRGIENLDLRVKEGEIFGFIGPNGAGKSTTIRLLLSLIFPTGGHGKIFDLDIVKKGPEIKQLVGFVPSEVNYYPGMTVKELLKYSAGFYKVPLNGYFDRLVQMMDLDLNRLIDDLSMGNKKKVALIQSLLHKPRLLILDEPTSGLDPLMQFRFFELLKEANSEGTTIFFSSHILSEVERFCHRVAIIKEGKVVEEANVSDLKQKMLTRITLRLSGEGSGIELKTPGILSLARQNNGYTFLYQGDILSLMKALIQFPIDKLTIAEPDLEEVFMHYYQLPAGKEGTL